MKVILDIIKLKASSAKSGREVRKASFMPIQALSGEGPYPTSIWASFAQVLHTQLGMDDERKLHL
jgi:hypothetical protein